MSANTISVTQPAVVQTEESGWRILLSDSLLMVKRNLLHIPRTPELLLDVTIQPIIFVLLFRYVFGGAIAVQGSSYVNYLMAGIFVQTLLFATIAAGIGLAIDMEKGLIDRFRSLPMSRPSILIGRTLTDLLRGLLAGVIIFAVGLCVGFRPELNLTGLFSGFGLILLFCFAFSWLGVAMGLLVRTSEAVQAAMFVFIFPLTFASSAFVPVETMPGWLRAFAENQPITIAVDTLRHAVLGQPLGTDAWLTFGWSLGVLALFFPLSVLLYQRRTTD